MQCWVPQLVLDMQYIVILLLAPTTLQHWGSATAQIFIPTFYYKTAVTTSKLSVFSVNTKTMSACLPTCLSICLSANLPACLSVCEVYSVLWPTFPNNNHRLSIQSKQYNNYNQPLIHQPLNLPVIPIAHPKSKSQAFIFSSHESNEIIMKMDEGK